MTAYHVLFAHSTMPEVAFSSPEEAHAYVRRWLGPDVRFEGDPSSGELAWVGDPLTPGNEMVSVFAVVDPP